MTGAFEQLSKDFLNQILNKNDNINNLFGRISNEGKLKLFWPIFIELDKLDEVCFIKRILVNGVSMVYDWSINMFWDIAFRRLLLILDTWSFKL
jgi:hypothetical protein